MEISLDALLGVQRHGQDLAYRLAQGVSGLLLHVQPPQLPWPAPALPLKLIPFDIELPVVPFVGGGVDLPAVAVASFVEIGGRLGQAGSELGASVGGAVQQLSRQIPVPFRAEGARRRKWEGGPAPPKPAAMDEGEAGLAAERAAEGGLALEGVGERDSLEEVAAAAAAATGSAAAASEGVDGSDEEEDGFEFEIGTLGKFMKPKGTVNVSATYNTRHHTVDSSVLARGEFWRLESSRGGSTNGNNNAPGFLIQLGPLLFVRDSTTLLLPINLSKQHLIWYAYDHKNGVHSLCPVMWSKHKKWLLMSMMCLNPVACAFMDVEFSNGQLRYAAGEGITASGFLPLFGGFLQAHGKFPGQTKLGFSFKSTQGTWFTPTYQWPDNSLSFGVAQALAWKKSGLMMRPGTQVSVCPTLGGSDPGIRAEIVHSLKEEIGVTCGFSCSRHPSAFTSLSIGRSKSNGEVGSSGVVFSENLPVICIVGGPNSNDYGSNRILHHTIGLPDFTQELRCFQNVTCYQAVVNNLEDAHEQIDTAISTALKESKPVYISISCNLPSIPHPTFSRHPVPFFLSPRLSNQMNLEAAVETAAAFLNKSVKPVLVGGPKMRVAKACEAFVELADACGYPVAVMPSAKGLVPEHHSRFIGTYWGAVSTPFCAEIVESADAYLFAGPIFNDYSSVGYSLLLKKEKAIIVQPDRVVIGNGPAFGCILMKDFLHALVTRLKKNTAAYDNYSRIFVPQGEPFSSEPGEPLRVNVLFKHIQKMLSGSSAVIAETGDSWFNCQKLKLPEGCGYEFQMQYGSIGWSVGATLGYAQAAKDKRVISFIGDGSFQVTAQEVSTMLRWGQNNIIFLINNGGYTIEVEIHDGPYNIIKNWNYTGVVEAFHNGEGKCYTAKVRTEEELKKAIEASLGPNKDSLCFIEVIVHKDDTSKELLEWGSRVSAANSRPPNPQ